MADPAPRCCGRSMSGIGVATGAGVLLHSCSSCGRHAWFSAGRELDRDALIDMLREDPPPAPASERPAQRPAAGGPARAPRTREAAPDARRTELRDLLRGFTVHGGSS